MEPRPQRQPLEPPLVDDRPLWDLWQAAYGFPTVTVADELGLFARLDEAPATAAEISAALHISDRAAEAMLALLAAHGFLVARDGRFHLTPLARSYLLPGSPFYWGGLFALYKDRPRTHAVVREALLHDRRLDAARATASWTDGDWAPERAAAMTAMMHAMSLASAVGLARLLDLSATTRLLDVAGGSGCFAVAFAERNPSLRATVLELPAVCAVADRLIAASPAAEQVGTHPANMFADPWPGGHDAVFFSNVFHDWDRDRCLDLGRRAFAALPTGGRILLHEQLLAGAKDGPLGPARYALMMAIYQEGKQFTFAELAALLGECGFVDPDVLPAYGDFSLVSARKP